MSGEVWHGNLQEPIEPLSVYLGKPGHRYNKVLTPFPVGQQLNGGAMPQWHDLSPWLKMQLAVMLLDQWQFQTFNIHIHRDLEEDWVKEERNVRATMRDRLRRELDKIVRPGLEHFFVIEGWSKKDKKPTLLHIHGGAAIYPETLFVEEETAEKRYEHVAGWLQLVPLVDVQRNLRALRSQVKAAAEDATEFRRIDRELSRVAARADSLRLPR